MAFEDFLFVLIPALFILILLGTLSCFIVRQQSAAIIERLGRFVRIAKPGLQFKIPFLERLAGTVTLRLMQMDVEVETKTQDDVFVNIMVSVQYRILIDTVYEAFYTLDNPEAQIRSYVFDVVRARVPGIKLDDLFSKKDEIADAVKEELQDVMNEFGYDILKALVTDIDPDAKVKSAMNEINESQRLRFAAMERGEAEKILKIKQAEAEAESKILQGKGLAGQRKAIIEGIRDSLNDFQQQINDANTQDIMHLIILSQYFDTLKELGASSQTNTILVPHSPSSIQDFYDQLRNTMIVSKHM